MASFGSVYAETSRPRECFGLWCLTGCCTATVLTGLESSCSVVIMDWIFVSPQNSYVEALTANVIVVRDGAFGRGIVRWGHGDGALMMGLVSLAKETSESLVSMGDNRTWYPCSGKENMAIRLWSTGFFWGEQGSEKRLAWGWEWACKRQVPSCFKGQKEDGY